VDECFGAVVFLLGVVAVRVVCDARRARRKRA
jgi:hypothetical protein